MTLQGKFRNGVVVLENGAELPEETPVTVVVEEGLAAPRKDNHMTEEEHRRMMEIMERIAAQPDENPGDTFRGRDHDKVLYGEA